MASEVEQCESCECVIEALEELCFVRAGDLVADWERADPRDSWRYTGDQPPPAAFRNSDITGKPAAPPRPHRPAQSTIDAFFYLTAVGDLAAMKAWLGDRPKDAPYLLGLLEDRKRA